MTFLSSRMLPRQRASANADDGRREDALLREVNFVVMARPGWSFDWHTLPPVFRHLQDHVVEAPLLDISATDIRDRVRAGKSIDRLVPRAVADYILARNLYRDAPM